MNTLRDLVQNSKDGDIIFYNQHKYMIITGMVIEDLDTNELLMLGIDF